jgi:hypothetical protein|tara:strand:+ start:627 stop:896 length:270 start_codon:yes stop_codon:yes gene_type:complete
MAYQITNIHTGDACCCLSISKFLKKHEAHVFDKITGEILTTFDKWDTLSGDDSYFNKTFDICNNETYEIRFIGREISLLSWLTNFIRRI